MPTFASAETNSVFAELAAANRAFLQRYPGPTPERQPVHTVYGGAHLFHAETTARLGALALGAMDSYGRDPIELALGVGYVKDVSSLSAGADALAREYAADAAELRRRNPAAWLVGAVHERVRRKLEREPVEDYRIDFEDGFGARPDEEEDAVARQAARELAGAFARGSLPPFIGIRIKSFSEEWAARGARTLELFLGELLGATGGGLPQPFLITLPKVTIPEQPRALVRLVDLLEQRHRLAPGALRVELMVEQTQALIGPDGRCPLPDLLAACDGRCFGAHLGTYDFTASCNLTAAYQTMRHPLCDLAKGMMVLALGGTGLFLSDGATNVMPTGPHKGKELSAEALEQNRRVVHAAWQLTHGNIRHSLEGGFYQGWDLHPAQLPVRYATTYAFFLEGFSTAAERLRNFIDKAAQATLVGDVFDDAATGQGLLNYFVRAHNCGAISDAELAVTGLTLEEFHLRSFAKILAARRARG
ncbi:MAG TPA: phosphoenolpyruvate kinase [Polyangiaceae bacterium]|nr:phosphoenolpyruvate kinase [Polyangiaceae bacterium]